MGADRRFTDDEWSALAAAPAAAASAIIGSGHAGFFGTMKELKAALKAIKHAAPTDPPAADLVRELVQYAKDNEDAGDTTDDTTDDDSADHEAIRAAALETMERAGLAAQKLSEDERDGYVGWLVGIAREVAQAAPDKGQKDAVSAAEEDTIAEIERRLRR